MVTGRFVSVIRITCVGAFAALVLSANGQPESAARPNVLFVVADDQRNNMGCYGDNHAKTPHLDRMAAEGTIFSRAYCQYAMCGPSRASLLTGLRPDVVKVYDLHTPVRRPNPDVLTLPQDFKNRGYHTRAIGKVFHPGTDDPESWSVPTFAGPEIVGTTHITSGTEGGLPDVTPGPGGGKRGPSWFAPNLPEDQIHDGVITREAIKALGELKDKPFFLAVGFNRPHLPFVAPKKYFDLYEGEELPVAENLHVPEGAPPIAITQSGELRQYRDIPTSGALSREKSRELTLAYYACTSFVDAQVGRLLDELERLGLDDETIVVFWGDHGFHLGENSLWAKYTNFETATRAPLMFRVPGGNTSTTVDAVVEFVDVYPTLAELCGWKPEDVHGDSLAGFIKGSKAGAPDTGTALSQVNRGDGMGYSIRTHHYRYTEWRSKSGETTARELYNHVDDPGENVNLANDPAMMTVIDSLQEELEKLISAKPGKA
jgi:arylsulfatase A-like enzyme